MIDNFFIAPRCILIEVIPPHVHHNDALKALAELELLTMTFGGLTVDCIVQHRLKPHPATYIGKGKLEELKEKVARQKIDIIIINAIINSGQIFRLEKTLWQINPKIKVFDKVDLILHIFEKHASSREAKLQIDLARLKHLGPRIYGLGGTLFSRQAGGIGTRGVGEKNLELMKRHFKKQINMISQELNKIEKIRESSINRRKIKLVKTVALVGYTNAGKTSLFNKLTGKTKLVHDSFFTTLDSNLGRIISLEDNSEVLISDTIGFIEGLPPFLIDAFKSTLMETVNADLLLQIIDSSDQLLVKKIAVVEEILDSIGVGKKKKILIFNKCDLIPLERQNDIKEMYHHNLLLFTSTKTGENINRLTKIIYSTLNC